MNQYPLAGDNLFEYIGDSYQQENIDTTQKGQIIQYGENQEIKFEKLQENQNETPQRAKDQTKSNESYNKVQKFISEIPHTVYQVNLEKYKSFKNSLQQKVESLSQKKNEILEQETQYQEELQKKIKETNLKGKKTQLKDLIIGLLDVVKTNNQKFSNFKQNFSNRVNQTTKGLKTPPAISKQINKDESNEEILKISESQKFLENFDEVQKNELQSYVENLSVNQQQGTQDDQTNMSAFIKQEPDQFDNNEEITEEKYLTQENKQGEIEFLGEYKVPTGFQMQGDNEITLILQVKSAQQDQTVSEASQIIQLIDQPENQFNIEGKPGRTPIPSKRSKFQQVFHEEELQSNLNKKERLKNILQDELNEVSHDIRELKEQRKVKEREKIKQSSVKIVKKQYYPSNNQVKNMIKISDDVKALERANELVARMNEERRQRRLRQQREYKYIEAMFRDEIDKLRKEQDDIHIKMENDRKFKIQKRVDEYHKRQLEFAQMQQANQQFIKDLMNRGPQEGQLAQVLDDKIQKIRGEPKQKKLILRNGSIIHLPSISSKRGQTIFQLQSESVEYGPPKQQQKYLRVKLPQNPTNEIQKSLLQVEMERAMIEKYKQSREQLIQYHFTPENNE